MYLLAHLLAGVLIGVLLFVVFRDRLVILVCALGSVLPDLVDKPLGYIFLADSLNYGRIYCHSLLFIGLVLIVGLLISLRYPRAGPLTLALAAGLLSHQLLDAMWLEAANWYWPALGPFKGKTVEGFFWRAFQGEISNPGEWMAGILLLAIFLVIALWPERVSRLLSRVPNRGALLVALMACSAAVFGLVVVAAGGIG